MTDPDQARPDAAGVPAASECPDRLGPILYLRACRDGRLHLTALAVRPADAALPELQADGRSVAPRIALERDGRRVALYAFGLPLDRDASYRFDGADYPVDTQLRDTLRIAYVSCNGQEHGDRARPLAERNALWHRLARQHAAEPFQLLLHGGDQLYIDELLRAHPDVEPWIEASRTPPACPRPAGEVADELRVAMFRRYLELLAQDDVAWLMARVPSLAMWDDHDICDGWGSLPAAKLDSPVGRAVFAAAREHFLLFQMGSEPDPLDAPFLDPEGRSLGWHVALPDLDLVAPDLRSERRPDRVMGETGWAAFDGALGRAGGRRLLVLSSVPALGPRLSWVERAMTLTRRAEAYEDDLRDQWQSRAHRAEWRSFLETLVARHEGAGRPVTLLSGEIHLATRGELATARGPLHQLVASGIAHPPPPRAYARALGVLARLGEAPLPNHPIRICPLPGRTEVYTPQRNYLVLTRRDGAWRAWWELEEDGPTPALDLD